MITNLKRFLRPLGLVFGLVAAASFIWYAARTWHAHDLSQFASLRGAVAIVAAGLFYATIIPTSAFAWRAILKGLGKPHSARSLTEILAISQIAKYIPGNVGAHLGRAGMATTRHMEMRAVVTSLLIEAALTVSAAFAVGCFGIMLSPVGDKVLAEGSVRSGLTAGALVLASATAVFVSYFLAWRSVRERMARNKAWPAMSHAFALYMVNYVMIGLGMWLMAFLLLPGGQHEVSLLVASFAIAWVAGFFAPGAPAGLGVREAIMLLVLHTTYSGRDALLIVVAMRLATTLADMAIFLAGTASAMRSSRNAKPH